MDIEFVEQKLCTNCLQEVPAPNFVTHEIHCRRNILVCEICQEPVQKTDIGTHIDTQHSTVACPKCGEDVNRSLLTNHIEFECLKRQILCEYCELEFPLEGLEEHSKYCGSRTEQCNNCTQYIMLSDWNKHVDTQCQHPENSHDHIDVNDFYGRNLFDRGDNLFSTNGISRVRDVNQSYRGNVAAGGGDDERYDTLFGTGGYYPDLLAKGHIDEDGASSNAYNHNLLNHKEMDDDHIHTESLVPCEFCGKAFAFDFIIQHQSLCVSTSPPLTPAAAAPVAAPMPAPVADVGIQRRRYNKELWQFDPIDSGRNNDRSGDTAGDEDLSDRFDSLALDTRETTLLPCEFCEDLFPSDQIVQHQEACGGNIDDPTDNERLVYPHPSTTSYNNNITNNWSSSEVSSTLYRNQRDVTPQEANSNLTRNMNGSAVTKKLTNKDLLTNTHLTSTTSVADKNINTTKTASVKNGPRKTNIDTGSKKLNLGQDKLGYKSNLGRDKLGYNSNLGQEKVGRRSNIKLTENDIVRNHTLSQLPRTLKHSTLPTSTDQLLYRNSASKRTDPIALANRRLTTRPVSNPKTREGLNEARLRALEGLNEDKIRGILTRDVSARKVAVSNPKTREALNDARLRTLSNANTEGLNEDRKHGILTRDVSARKVTNDSRAKGGVMNGSDVSSLRVNGKSTATGASVTRHTGLRDFSLTSPVQHTDTLGTTPPRTTLRTTTSPGYTTYTPAQHSSFNTRSYDTVTNTTSPINGRRTDDTVYSFDKKEPRSKRQPNR